MPLPQSKNRVGLGHAIFNRRAKEARMQHSSEFHTTDTHVGQPKYTRLQSVTHQGDLEEFLNTASLADADFTAERRNNVKVVDVPSESRTRHNPYLLTAQQEASVLDTHAKNRERLRVPRRPVWSSNTTPAQLERAEKDSFLEWRRGLAELQDGFGLVLTPFERNIEVWRQLWRVIERSQLLVQIVDARNPIRFRCEDLEKYVRNIPANLPDMASVPPEERDNYQGPRNTLLLINKADLLTQEQRRTWSRYFQENRVNFAFFSAADETARQLAKQQRETQFAAAAGNEDAQAEEELRYRSHTDGDVADPARILNVLELEELFIKMAPSLALFERDGDTPEKLTVGLVGYPNVGKSSTINALLGEKKVSVSSTPGKTKHFQTIHLSPTTILCDCPGLVFPQFSTSPADLVCDGILPIDQMREYTAPAELVAQRIPKQILEKTYNIHIPVLSEEEGGKGQPTGLELLSAYAVARGFVRQGQGNPDESRAARYVLKDYNSARLLFAHPPPGVDADAFNEEQRENTLSCLSENKPRAQPTEPADPRRLPVTAPASKTNSLDNVFFGTGPAPGVTINGRRATAPPGRASENIEGVPQTLKDSSKKHFKGNKRSKQRSGAGYA
ncbi:hypothetical protein MVES1_000476 [Malassezia vespertilionis]|uniref:CP-type G domain-containing protein n=1 Tax=Malassezia vespertilionis TaxID=2020962 RepID=A0A2N1JFN8_9BASI|nr:uncharacterized protein MVES1_000476 [Malassezia vespertilionis]PKI85370.1 hypothetical protein MVES_000438 [Malassezia vespertilionis]WFD05150.1 hypothetical protein MVES1_000476 [Malassezia vespertilionis]